MLTAFARRTAARAVVLNNNRMGKEQMKRLRNPLATLALGAGLAFSQIAQATLVLDDGTVFYGFVASSGPADFRLTLRMDFSATQIGSEFLGDRIEAWSLQLPGAATSTLIAAPGVVTDWTVYDSGKAVGGNNGCGNGNVKTICVDREGNAKLHGTGPVVTNTFFDWVIDIDFTPSQTFSSGGNFHLLTVREDKDGEWKQDADLISLDLGALLKCVPSTTGGGCTPPPPREEEPSVPEPGSLALIGLGAMLARALRRRHGKAN